MNSQFTKATSQVISQLVKDVFNMLDISNEELRVKLGDYIHFDYKEDGDCEDGLKTALRPDRGLSPKYFESIDAALHKILEDWAQQSSKKQTDDNIERVILNEVLRAMDKLVKTLEEICPGTTLDRLKKTLFAVQSAKSNTEMLAYILIALIQNVLIFYQKYQFLIERINDFDLPKKFYAPDAMKDLSPIFSYRLNACFCAISSLTNRDLYFLIIHHYYNQNNDIDHILCQYYDVSYDEIFCKVKSLEFNKFLKMSECFRECSKGQNSDPIKNWTSFLSKYQKERTYELSEMKGLPYTRINIIFFLQIIYPRNSMQDTDFTARDIDALLKFRLFLSEEAQVQFISKMKKQHPRPLCELDCADSTKKSPR